MNTLHTVKNISVAGLLVLALSPVYMYTSGVRKNTSDCNFTKTHMETLDLVKAQKCSRAEEVDNCFLRLYSDFREVVRIVDPTLEPGPIRADYHETIKSMVMEEFNTILNSHSERFTALARNVGETTQAGKMLTKIAQSLHEMGQVFVKHMAVCEELARTKHGAQYTREQGIEYATSIFRMKKLQQDLQEYVFLMPIEMNDLGTAQWKKIITTLF